MSQTHESMKSIHGFLEEVIHSHPHAPHELSNFCLHFFFFLFIVFYFFLVWMTYESSTMPCCTLCTIICVIPLDWISELNWPWEQFYVFIYLLSFIILSLLLFSLVLWWGFVFFSVLNFAFFEGEEKDMDRLQGTCCDEFCCKLYIRRCFIEGVWSKLIQK